MSGEPPIYYGARIGGELADPYRIAMEYGITNPAQSHALKYLLRAGHKHGESWADAMDKAIHALSRARDISPPDLDRRFNRTMPQGAKVMARIAWMNKKDKKNA